MRRPLSNGGLRGRMRAGILRACLLLSGIATAEPLTALPEQASSPAKSESLRHFNAGTAFYEQGNIERALAEFEASFTIYETRAALKNRALCLERLGHPDEALDLLDRFAEKFGVPDGERDDYDTTRGELSRRVGFIDFSTVAPGAQITIDGRARGTTPRSEPVRATQGARHVVLSSNGQVLFDTTLNVEAAKITPFRTMTKGDQAAPAPDSGAAAANAPGEGPPAGRASPERALSRFWIGLEGGGVFTPTLGGVGSCEEGCDSSAAWGGRAAVTFGVALDRRFQVELALGYLRATQQVTDRATPAHLAGEDTVLVRAADNLTLSGATLGLMAELQPWSWGGFRLGTGLSLTAARDERSVMLPASATGVPTEITPKRQSRTDFVYAAVGLFGSHAFDDHFAIDLGVDALLLHALRRAYWYDSEPAKKIATFPAESLTGSTLFLLSPFLRARYRF